MKITHEQAFCNFFFGGAWKSVDGQKESYFQNFIAVVFDSISL